MLLVQLVFPHRETRYSLHIISDNVFFRGILKLTRLPVHVFRELGLDELLNHCEGVAEKLRHPEKEPCYQAMAGTALFTHTAFDMLQNHSRYGARFQPVVLILCTHTVPCRRPAFLNGQKPQGAK